MSRVDAHSSSPTVHDWQEASGATPSNPAPTRARSEQPAPGDGVTVEAYRGPATAPVYVAQSEQPRQLTGDARFLAGEPYDSFHDFQSQPGKFFENAGLKLSPPDAGLQEGGSYVLKGGKEQLSFKVHIQQNHQGLNYTVHFVGQDDKPVKGLEQLALVKSMSDPTVAMWSSTQEVTHERSSDAHPSPELVARIKSSVLEMFVSQGQVLAKKREEHRRTH